MPPTPKSLCASDSPQPPLDLKTIILMQLFKYLAIPLGLLAVYVSALPAKSEVGSTLTRRQTCAGGRCNPDVGCGTECICTSAGVSDRLCTTQ